MERKNTKKTKAAADEDFELAAKYRNQYNQLKSKLLQFNEVQAMIDLKPQMTLRQLLEVLIELEDLKFSKNLID